MDLTLHPVGYAALFVFFAAYALAMVEEITELRKSKPMVAAASLIWVLIAAMYAVSGYGEAARVAFRSHLEGYAELLLFILVSMTYLNAMEDRGVFESLRVWLLGRGFSYRQLFWITGALAFMISAACNNLTTALLMGAVVLALGKDERRFIAPACVNIVVATNAGGSFSPFGDITTLLVWQKGVVPFGDFFSLLVPSVVNFAVPAAIMYFFIPGAHPAPVTQVQPMKRGARRIMALFLFTIVTAACFENFLNLPPVAGMLFGLTYLKFFSYYLQKTAIRPDDPREATAADEMELRQMEIAATSPTASEGPRLGELLLTEQIITEAQLRQVLETQELRRLQALAAREAAKPFDVFQKVAQLEWDTLLFFYGVMLGVGGLSFLGYLEVSSHFLYGTIEPTVANILVGIASAFIDNGTIMLAVLTMAPDISQGQWLLVTLTAGVGGSLLAVGSAAGVGLLGQAKGLYSFTSHLKWTPAILLGYFASIGAHFLLNGRYF
ncbi:MAG TPA: sodium:proton antiporter NhaD [Methylococcaceae bacterium]|nr:sodium:proton antiporter NhaD [Methylococcaceae bacterium]